jgi:hypothetical protein
MKLGVKRAITLKKTKHYSRRRTGCYQYSSNSASGGRMTKINQMKRKEKNIPGRSTAYSKPWR